MENGGRGLLLDGALTIGAEVHHYLHIQQLTYCIPHPIYPTNAPKLFPINPLSQCAEKDINQLFVVCFSILTFTYSHFLVAISFLFNLLLYQDCTQATRTF